MDWLPAVSIISGALIGLGGLGFGWWNAKSERRLQLLLSDKEGIRQRNSAQEAREYDVRKDTYEELMYVLGLLIIHLEYRVPSAERLTEVLQERRLDDGGSVLSDPFGESISPPERAQLLRTAAKVATLGSLEVSDMAECFLVKYYRCLGSTARFAQGMSLLTLDHGHGVAHPPLGSTILRAAHARTEAEELWSQVYFMRGELDSKISDSWNDLESSLDDQIGRLALDLRILVESDYSLERSDYDVAVDLLWQLHEGLDRVTYEAQRAVEWLQRDVLGDSVPIVPEDRRIVAKRVSDGLAAFLGPAFGELWQARTELEDLLRQMKIRVQSELSPRSID